VWASPAIDLKTKTVFLVTGNPYPDFDGDERPGDNLYSDSLVAIDLETGKYKWHFQYVPHDVWDLDSSSPPLLAEIEIDKKIIPVVVHANKVGHVYVHDRSNGKLINFSEPMIPIKKWSLEKRDTYKNIQGSPFPDRESGVNWSALAHNPNNNLVYAMNRVKNMDILDDFDNYVYTGKLVAVDISNGKIAWTEDSNFPMQGGVLYTTGNLIFYGNGDGIILAKNAETGDDLWSYKCDAGANSPPASYMLDGKQYIIIGCGGNQMWNHKYGKKFYIFSL